MNKQFMKQFILTAIILGALSKIVFAQNINKAELDSFFNALEVNNKLMGSIAVAKNGEIIYSKSIGFSDVENKIKATKIQNTE
jgi:D-alanyl-D-alanine carboxypeptidase